jgi:hypothetical protein
VCDAPGGPDRVRTLAAEQLLENFRIAEDLLAGREFFFDHFMAPDAHFFWCFRRATQFELDLSPFKNCSAHFDRTGQRPSAQKLLAFEKSVQEQFATAAYAKIVAPRLDRNEAQHRSLDTEPRPSADRLGNTANSRRRCETCDQTIVAS